MPLKLPPDLKFGHSANQEALEPEAVSQLLTLARRIDDVPLKHLLESLKRQVARQSGQEYYESSSADWAETDLQRLVSAAASHEVIAAFYNLFESLEANGIHVPTEANINNILIANACPYRIQNGELISKIAYVEPPNPPPLPEDVVEQALKDAKALLGQSGASSAIDRLHTALHGYLRHLCKEENITPASTGPTASELFKLLRQQHPALAPEGPRPEDISRIVRACANVIDALSTIRNKATRAHPNEVLPEPEAAAVVNATHTVFRYVHDKMRQHGQ